MSDRGWCPFATQHRSAEGPFGYPEGTRDQNRPLCFVDHRMGGYKRTLDDDQWRHANGVGVHFGIGRDGSIDQYTGIFDASWGNGVSGDKTRYDRSNAALAEIEALGTWVPVSYAGSKAWALTNNGVNTINTHTISTEHEDETKDQPWTDAMIDATIRVKRWCLEELDRYGMPMPVRDAKLAGHFQIDAVNRSGCPGDNWPRATILARLMEEDDVKPFLVWCDQEKAAYIVGPTGAKPVYDRADYDAFEKEYGAPTLVLTSLGVKALQ